MRRSRDALPLGSVKRRGRTSWRMRAPTVVASMSEPDQLVGNLMDWRTLGAERDHFFFVQEDAKEMWHVETDDNCERMLCGKFISINSKTARIQSQWGPRRCPDCWMRFQELARIQAMAQ